MYLKGIVSLISFIRDYKPSECNYFYYYYYIFKHKNGKDPILLHPFN